MDRVRIEDVEPIPDEDLHTDRRVLSDALGTTDVAVVRYALAPGERFSGAVHAHTEQEEIFVVVEGEATFDTADEELVVRAGEAVRFAPGEFQTGWNASNEELVALALGAPKDGVDVLISRIPVLDDRDVSCPACGLDHLRISGEGPGLVCPECDARLEIE